MGRRFKTGVGQRFNATFHNMTITVITRTVNVIDSFYVAASSALPIRPLVLYVDSNFILICNAGRAYIYCLRGDSPHWAKPRLIPFKPRVWL